MALLKPLSCQAIAAASEPGTPFSSAMAWISEEVRRPGVGSGSAAGTTFSAGAGSGGPGGGGEAGGKLTTGPAGRKPAGARPFISAVVGGAAPPHPGGAGGGGAGRAGG